MLRKMCWIFLMIVPFFVSAQKVAIGVGGFLGVSKFDQSKIQNNLGFSESIGGVAEYELTQKVFMSLGLNYKQYRSSRRVTVRDENDVIVGEDKVKFNQDAIQVPLDFGVKFGKNVKLVSSVGGYFSFLSGRVNDPSLLQFISVIDSDVCGNAHVDNNDPCVEHPTNDWSQFDYGVQVKMGINIPINEHQLNFGMVYSRGLQDVLFELTNRSGGTYFSFIF